MDASPFEAERPAPAPIEFAMPDSDDSYEAALRAADALFSNPSKEPVRGSEETPPDTIWDGAANGSAAAPDRNGGRILRALDEEPSPQLMALEAERAPKRRGRKPGSKNKPKIAAVVAIPDETATPRRPAARRAMALTPAAVDAPASSPPAIDVAAAMAGAGVRAAKRTGWSRGRLRPGEDWKRRRLPRVCW